MLRLAYPITMLLALSIGLAFQASVSAKTPPALDPGEDVATTLFAFKLYDVTPVRFQNQDVPESAEHELCSYVMRATIRNRTGEDLVIDGIYALSHRPGSPGGDEVVRRSARPSRLILKSKQAAMVQAEANGFGERPLLVDWLIGVSGFPPFRVGPYEFEIVAQTDELPRCLDVVPEGQDPRLVDVVAPDFEPPYSGGTAPRIALRAIIDEQGHARAPQPLEFSNGRLAQSVLGVIDGWTFEPATILGRPVAQEVLLDIRDLRRWRAGLSVTLTPADASAAEIQSILSLPPTWMDD